LVIALPSCWHPQQAVAIDALVQLRHYHLILPREPENALVRTKSLAVLIHDWNALEVIITHFQRSMRKLGILGHVRILLDVLPYLIKDLNFDRFPDFLLLALCEKRLI